MYKKYIYLVLVVTLLILNTGCEKRGTPKHISAPDNVLEVYYLEQDKSINDRALNEFKKEHNDIKVIEKSIQNSEIEDFALKFKAQLAAGTGADILFMPMYLLPPISKLFDSGVLCDLNPLIAQDKSFKIEDYNQIVMDSCTYNGKRYMMPIDYTFFYFYTYKAVLGDFKLNTINWTWDELINAEKEYFKKGTGASKYFISPSFDFSVLLIDSKPYVNYERKISEFNTPEFIKLLKIYKTIAPLVCPIEEYTSQNEFEKMEMLSVLQSSFCTGVGDSLGFNDYNKAFGEDAIILPYPTLDGKGDTNAWVDRILAITSKCRYKQEAFDYIEGILSKENQMSDKLNVPVNNAAFKEQLELVKIIRPDSQIEELFKTVNSCSFLDASVLDIINKELPDYLNGKKSAEQIAKVIDEKVSLYLNE
ncbi:carbohydrate ABC transporter substrate-binding protein [Ruminiclostridium herbifermentans]|uniref:Carbohydrate ABC transporter substrate-binding protein n=1 Tax=Ruminiclostridium herbifermentans TaxID=2488810 RepID=A0A4U7JH05_9FIRM|nr:ABC transporter substrate-binding protein [Ruminiclostridium herbifermentans]QNU67317.1 carbohydrate ABC transporter substrate-binding protein [Ruminiclostridium herbifermentans]